MYKSNLELKFSDYEVQKMNQEELKKHLLDLEKEIKKVKDELFDLKSSLDSQPLQWFIDSLEYQKELTEKTLLTTEKRITELKEKASMIVEGDKRNLKDFKQLLIEEIEINKVKRKEYFLYFKTILEEHKKQLKVNKIMLSNKEIKGYKDIINYISSKIESLKKEEIEDLRCEIKYLINATCGEESKEYIYNKLKEENILKHFNFLNLEDLKKEVEKIEI